MYDIGLQGHAISNRKLMIDAGGWARASCMSVLHIVGQDQHCDKPRHSLVWRAMIGSEHGGISAGTMLPWYAMLAYYGYGGNDDLGHAVDSGPRWWLGECGWGTE